MDRSLFLIFMYIVIRLEMIHCSESSFTLDDDLFEAQNSLSDQFCRDLNNKYLQITQQDKTLQQNIKLFNLETVSPVQEVPHDFESTCKSKIEEILQYDSNVTFTILMDFDEYWCTESLRGPSDCLDLAAKFAPTFGFEVAVDICSHLKIVYKIQFCTSDLAHLIFEYEITNAKRENSKDDKVTCLKCLKHINNCNEETTKDLEVLSRRVDTLERDSFVVYPDCDAIWIDDILLPETEEKKNTIFSILLSTPRQETTLATSAVCSKNDYELVISYLLQEGKEESYKYFKDPQYLGTICYHHLLVFYPLSLIETFVEARGLHGGMEFLVTNHKATSKFILDKFNNSTKGDPLTPQDMGKNKEFPALMNVVTVGFNAVNDSFTDAQKLQMYYDKIVIPILEALNVYYSHETADNVEK